MTSKNYILISLDNEKSKAIAEVLSSKTSKKIINYLAENKEASQKDLSDALKIPLNTIDYNIKKLLSSGFIQKTKNFFWSKKGKKIIMYELSKKSVIISHKKSVSQKIKSILPAFILTAVGTLGLWIYEKSKTIPRTFAESYREEILQATKATADSNIQPSDLITPIGTPLWLWFLVGSLLAILIISIINWKKL